MTEEEASLWDFLRNKMGWGTDVMLKFREVRGVRPFNALICWLIGWSLLTD